MRLPVRFTDEELSAVLVARILFDEGIGIRLVRCGLRTVARVCLMAHAVMGQPAVRSVRGDRTG